METSMWKLPHRMSKLPVDFMLNVLYNIITIKIEQTLGKCEVMKKYFETEVYTWDKFVEKTCSESFYPEAVHTLVVDFLTSRYHPDDIVSSTIVFTCNNYDGLSHITITLPITDETKTFHITLNPDDELFGTSSPFYAFVVTTAFYGSITYDAYEYVDGKLERKPEPVEEDTLVEY